MERLILQIVYVLVLCIYMLHSYLGLPSMPEEYKKGNLIK